MNINAPVKAHSSLSVLTSLMQPQLDLVDVAIEESFNSYVDLVEVISKDILHAGGKRVRPLLTLGVATWLGCKDDSAVRLAATVELVHTATLLHDDVIDASLRRRGKPSANALWGNTISVLVGDFLLAQSFRLMVSTRSHVALECLSATAAQIAEGELMQLALVGKADANEDDYIKVITRKTAQLFATATEFGGLAANAEPNVVGSLREMGLRFGQCFQIIDDILDYQPLGDGSGKPHGQDFREGKPTLPWFAAIRDATQKEQVRMRRLLAKDKRSNADIEWVLDIVRRTKSIERSYDHAHRLAEETCAILMTLPEHPVRQHLFGVVHELIERHR